MMIDEPIEKHKKLKISAERNNDKRGAFYSGEEHKQIAEWLEELKFLRQWKSDVMDEFCKYDCNSVEEAMHNGYNKAIDDFVESVKNLIADSFVIRFKDIDEIAEQLKEGGKNE